MAKPPEGLTLTGPTHVREMGFNAQVKDSEDNGIELSQPLGSLMRKPGVFYPRLFRITLSARLQRQNYRALQLGDFEALQRRI